MPDRHRGGHYRRRPPPWWPEGEAWPPANEAAADEWRHRRGGIVWGIGCFLVVVAVLLVSFFALLSWFIGSVLGSSAGFVPVLLIGLFVLLVVGAVIRIFRMAAAPVGDLIEASGRVEAGDFSARVPE